MTKVVVDKTVMEWQLPQISCNLARRCLMAPDNVVLKAFNAKIINGPSPTAFIEWTIACQKGSMEGKDEMNFTISLEAGEKTYQLRLIVTGIFNSQCDGELKVFGFIEEIEPELLREDEIKKVVIKKEKYFFFSETNLNKMVAIVYCPRTRKGRIYGPISNLNITAFLCHNVPRSNALRNPGYRLGYRLALPGVTMVTYTSSTSLNDD